VETRSIDLNLPWYVEPDQQQDYLKWAQANRTPEGPSVDVVKGLIGRSPAFLGHNYCKIQDINANLVLFGNWTPAQRKLYRVIRNLQRRGLPVRVLILKARQMGISTLCELIGYQKTGFTPNVTAMVAAQDDDGVQAVFEKFRTYYLSTPDLIRPVTDRFSVEEIRFGESKRGGGELGLASRILTKTMGLGGARKGESGKGRGATYHFFHGSECGFWPQMHADRFMTATLPAIPSRAGTVVLLESTANGTGGFYHTRWSRASEGWRMVRQESGHPRWMNESGRGSIWVPVFLSWLEHPEYAMPLPFKGSEKGYERERKAYSRSLNKAEQRLTKDFGATLEQVEWRRWKLDDEMNGDERSFMQEFPAEPEEAFQSSERFIFDQQALQEYRTRIMNDPPPKIGHIVKGDRKFFVNEDPYGPFKLFKSPVKGNLYVVGADPCEGRGPDGDNACAQVLCAWSPNPTECWEQVAVWTDRVDPDEFGHIIVDIGRWFNDAMIVCETNGPGLSATQALKTNNYWNRYRRRDYDGIRGQYVTKWDWHTNTKTRSVMVGALRGAIRQRRFVLHDPDTLHELKEWVKLDSGRARGKEGPSSSSGHDDRIMALGLALQGGLLDNPASPDEPTPSDEVRSYDSAVSLGWKDPTLRNKPEARAKKTTRQSHPVLGSDW
jgi:hypothetical protein